MNFPWKRGCFAMARFRKMAVGAAAPVAPSEDAHEVQQQRAKLAEAAAIVARDSVIPAPPVEPAESARYAMLSQLGVKVEDKELGRRAMDIAARLVCMKPGTGGESEHSSVRMIGRFLVWAAVDGVIDQGRAFTRARVDEYLLVKAPTYSRGSICALRCTLYGIGRRLHPQQFPPGVRMTPVPVRTLPTSRVEVEQLQAMVTGLPTALGRRLQTLLDLAGGAGARSSELKMLRGNAITSISVGGHAIAVVTLPNLGGGIRQVPVLDEQASLRLLDVADRVGEGLVLAPHTTKPGHNVVNSINNELRRHRLQRVSATGLRHRWILDLAVIAPAALLFQLADVSDLRFVHQDRKLLPTYTPHSAARILQENRS